MLENLKRKITFVCTALILAGILHLSVAAAQQSLLQNAIAGEVLRFHVLANSDSEEDQQAKLAVRDGVLAWIEEVLQKEESEETDASRDRAYMKQFLAAHLTELTAAADQILIQRGMGYRASAAVEICYIPNRTYGACTFPAGYYEALRIRLGKAQGHNWWCMLYPQLCFTDCLHAVVEEEQLQKLEEVLTVEEYESLLQKPEEWRLAFRWF